MKRNELILSPLPKTWIFDIDGTLVKHNGYKIDGKDTLLPDTQSFLSNIGENDLVVLITSRKEEQRAETEKFLRDNNIRFDHLICNAPYGERILINDKKPSGLKMAIAINIDRNGPIDKKIIIDDNL